MKVLVCFLSVIIWLCFCILWFPLEAVADGRSSTEILPRWMRRISRTMLKILSKITAFFWLVFPLVLFWIFR
jgi:hypothetical protein